MGSESICRLSNSTYFSIILCFLFESLTLRATEIKRSISFYTPSSMLEEKHSRQRVNDVFRKSEHTPKFLSFWVHKVGLKLWIMSHSVTLCVLASLNGNYKTKDSFFSVLSKLECEYVFSVYSFFLENQGVLSELSKVYRGKWSVIIISMFRGFTGNSEELKGL